MAILLKDTDTECAEAHGLSEYVLLESCDVCTLWREALDSGCKSPYELACVEANVVIIFLNGLWILRHCYIENGFPVVLHVSLQCGYRSSAFVLL